MSKTKIRSNQLEISEILNDPDAQATDTSNGTLRIATQAEVNSRVASNIALTPATINNWLTANSGGNFGTAPISSDTNSIVIGNAAEATAAQAIAAGSTSRAWGVSSIAIGDNVTSNGECSIVLGAFASAVNTTSMAIGFTTNTSADFQVVIGSNITPAAVPHSVTLGSGTPDVNQNYLHLHSKGKLELVGDEAQFIMPNHPSTALVSGSPLGLNPVSGSTIFDSTIKKLTIYDGTAWSAVGSVPALGELTDVDLAGSPLPTSGDILEFNGVNWVHVDNTPFANKNWLTANAGDDFVTAPIANTNAIAIGNNTSAFISSIVIGYNALATTTTRGIAIGYKPNANGTDAIAMGLYATATSAAISIGKQSDAYGAGSIAIGDTAQVLIGNDLAIVVGTDSQASGTEQVVIGPNITAADVTTDVPYSAKIGSGNAANLNLLHLYNKGKLELYGDEAQFIAPNYTTAEIAVPLVGVEGGMIWDTTTKELKVHDGATWAATISTSATVEYVDAKTVINWEVAEALGNALFIVSSNSPALAALNGTDVAFIDDGQDDLRTYRFDGTDWAQVGNDLNIVGTGNPALTALNSTDVAFIDNINDDLRTYRFDGTDWAQVGNDLNIVGSSFPAIAALNGTDIAFIDGTNADLRTYRFDGTNWAQVGNDLNIAGLNYPALAALNGTDVVFVDGVLDTLQTYRFDGTDWATVGNGLAVTVSYPVVTALNETDVAFVDATNDEFRTYRFDGTDWTQEGTGLSAAVSTFKAITALNGTDVAYFTTTGDILQAYKFNASVGYPDMVSVMDTRYIHPAPTLVSETWSLTDTSYEFDGTDLSAKLIDQGGAYISDDGLHMYALRFNADDVYHYTLSTAWDITSAVFANEKLAIAEVTTPTIGDIQLDPTGTKMYLLGRIAGTIFQYTLSTAWNVATATYDSVSYPFAPYSEGDGFYFRADGTDFYVVDSTTNNIYHHRMTTAWDISTSGFVAVPRINLVSQDGNPKSISFSPDGRTMMMLGSTNESVFQYTLSDPWNLYTLAYTGNSFTPDTGLGLFNLEDMFVRPDGLKMILIDQFAPSALMQFDTAGSKIISPASTTVLGTTLLASQRDVNDGLKYDAAVTAATLAGYNKIPKSQVVNAGFDMTNAVFDNIAFPYTLFPDINLNTSMEMMRFSLDGLNLFTTERNNVTTPNCYQYILETPFDIQSITPTYKTAFLNDMTALPRSIAVSTDGTKYFIYDDIGLVWQYTMSVANDISTATYDTVNFEVKNTASWIGRAIFFRPDGGAMFVTDNINRKVTEWTLSVPWDIGTTPVIGTEFFVPSPVVNLDDILFSADGTQLMVMTDTNGIEGVYTYDLGTAWNVSTAVFSLYYSTKTEDIAPTTFTTSLDGTKMFIAGLTETPDVIYQYSISSPDGTIVPASETSSGVVELATQTEVDAGTDTARAVTPATLQKKAEETAMLMSIVLGI